MLFPSNYLPYSTPFYSLLIHQPTLYIDCTPLSRCKDALCLGPHLLFLQQQALHTPSSLYPCSIRYSLYSCRGDHHSIVGFRQEWLPTVVPPPSYYLSGLSSLPFIWIPIDTITSFLPYYQLLLTHKYRMHYLLSIHIPHYPLPPTTYSRVTLKQRSPITIYTPQLYGLVPFKSTIIQLNGAK